MKKFVAPGFLTSILFASCCFAARMTLTPQKPIVIPGPAGHFDFMMPDSSMARILAAHKGTKELQIIDLKTVKLLPAISVGQVQGVAVDPKSHRYFVGNEGEHTVAVVDALTLKKTGEVKVDGPVDAIAYDPQNKTLYAAEDDGSHVWAINTRKLTVVATIPIPGEPEVLAFDPVTHAMYLNIKSKDELVRINPTSNKIDATWSTLPATSPHGLEVDSVRGRLYSAGHNGKLVAINLYNGKVVSTAAIPKGVDQIAYDVPHQVIYSACKGFISMTKVSDRGLKTIAQIPSPKGAHTLAVDPKSHDVWVSFADQQHSYLQRFKVTR